MEANHGSIWSVCDRLIRDGGGKGQHSADVVRKGTGVSSLLMDMTQDGSEVRVKIGIV